MLRTARLNHGETDVETDAGSTKCIHRGCWDDRGARLRSFHDSGMAASEQAFRFFERLRMAGQ